jgi:hypothetical protein
MNKRSLGSVIYGLLCAVSAVVLYASAVRFWILRNQPYAGLASAVMAVVGLITALSFSCIAASMFFPKRFKRFWKWWSGDG